MTKSAITAQLTQYLLQSRRHAIIVALIFSFIPFLGWIGTSIMALVVLRKGILEGSILLLWLALPYAVFAAFGYTQPLIEEMIFGNIIVWLLAITLRQTNSWGIVLQLATLIGVFIILMIHLFYPDIAASWEKLLNAMIAQLNKQGFHITFKPTSHGDPVKFMAKVATGFQTEFTLLSDLLILVLARGWQAMLFNPGGLKAELYQVRLSPITGIISMLLLFAAIYGVTLVWDLLPVVLSAFLLAGLSLVHYLLGTHKNSYFWLGVFYISLIVLFPQVSLLLISIAFIDTWTNLRLRAKNSFKN